MAAVWCINERARMDGLMRSCAPACAHAAADGIVLPVRHIAQHGCSGQGWSRADTLPAGLLQLTYPLHIILRYEIEKELMEGTLQPEEVPRVWNEKMQEYLGVSPPDDAKGCLQVRPKGQGWGVASWGGR